MRFILAAACLALGTVSAAVSATDDTHPFGVRDMVAFDRLADPRVSPDGSRIVFTVSSLDLDANKRRSDLWLVGTDGAGLHALTRDDATDSNGTWSPDGRTIFFLSTRSRLIAGLEAAARRRRGAAGDRAAARRRQFPALARRNEARAVDGGLPRLRRRPSTRKRLDDEQRTRRPARSTTASSSGTGTPGPTVGALTSSSFRSGRESRRRHEGHGRRLAVEAVRRHRGVHVHPGRQGRSCSPRATWGARRRGRRTSTSFVAPIDGSAAPRNLTAANKAWDATRRSRPTASRWPTRR